LKAILEQFGAIWSHLEPFGAIWGRRLRRVRPHSKAGINRPEGGAGPGRAPEGAQGQGGLAMATWLPRWPRESRARGKLQVAWGGRPAHHVCKGDGRKGRAEREDLPAHTCSCGRVARERPISGGTGTYVGRACHRTPRRAQVPIACAQQHPSHSVRSAAHAWEALREVARAACAPCARLSLVWPPGEARQRARPEPTGEPLATGGAMSRCRVRGASCIAVGRMGTRAAWHSSVRGWTAGPVSVVMHVSLSESVRV